MIDRKGAGSSQWVETRGRAKFLFGCALVSMGTLMSAGGGSWDITNHLLNRPETFFSPPHALLYAGVAFAVAGAALVAIFRRSVDPIKASKTKLPSILVVAGVTLLVSAGPIDYAWHNAFGLDGLLSPPHLILLSGMVISSIGALLGLIYQNYHYRYGNVDGDGNVVGANGKSPIAPLLIILGTVPVLIAATGVVHMFSLPFSNTDYFNFNPDPTMGAIAATLGFPFITSLFLYSSSAFAGAKRFGIMSAVGASFIAISALSSIIPNEYLIPTLPFFIMNMIPVVAADAIFSFVPSRMSKYLAGAIIGSAFLMMYYPLITHTYNEALDNQLVLASTTASVYFGLIGSLYPVVVVPAISMGILGAIVGQRLATKIESSRLA